MRYTKKAGTTLIEFLVFMSISLVCVVMISGMFSYSKHVITRLDQTREQEWEIFLIQVEQDTVYAKEMTVSEESMRFKHLQDPLNLSIEQTEQKFEAVELTKGKQDWLNYSVNGGTNIILTNVRSVSFALHQRRIKITVVFTDGEQKQGVIAYGLH